MMEINPRLSLATFATNSIDVLMTIKTLMQTTVHIRKRIFYCLVKTSFKISCVVSSGPFFYLSVHWEHLMEISPDKILPVDLQSK